jgi:hypothetical protein
MNRDLAQGQARHVMRARNASDRVTSPAGARRHLQTIRRVTTNSGFNTAARLDHAPDQRDVFLFDFVIVELAREFVVSRVVLGDDHEAGRAAVKSMHDARSEFPSHAAQVVEVVQQRIDDRSRCMTGARMHHHAGRFVHDGEIAILVHDVERQCLTRHG